MAARMSAVNCLILLACAVGFFSAHFTTRSSCVVYDFLFTWKTAFKNVIISNVILCSNSFRKSTVIFCLVCVTKSLARGAGSQIGRKNVLFKEKKLSG